MESDGGTSCYFVGAYPRRAAALGGKSLSALERDALEEVERLAASSEYFLDMSFADGDIQFLNNRAIFHGRTDYEDFPEVGRRRHLMRLWLRVPTWPALDAGQVFNTREEQQLWASNRERLAELPSNHMRNLLQRVAALSNNARQGSA